MNESVSFATIPKIIHYCWFGKNKKNPLIEKCIQSWYIHCPDFVIKEWNEENYDMVAHPFTEKMYSEKKWAFVADYARLEILEREGGFYLDTDMLLLKSLSPLCNHTCVLGEEEPGIISAGMLGVTPHHPYITQAKKYYNEEKALATIPRILTSVYTSFPDKKNIFVCPPHFFYPFDQTSIHTYRGQKLSEEIYGVHLWNYSWGHPLNKFFKKIGIYSFGKKIVELLGIKKVLKKILGFV